MLDPFTRRLISERQPDSATGPLVLVYHAISAGPGAASRYTVPLADFCTQLDLLVAGNWRTLGIADALQAPTASRSVVITFDDGYADNLERAVPELVRRGMTAAFFVVSCAIGRRGEDLGMLPGAMLTATQLREMRALGMEIGAHGRTHRRLCSLEAADRELEVAGAKAELEDLLGERVRYFAYPFGEQDEALRSQVARAGYEAAFTTRPQWLRQAPDAFEVGRVTITAEDGAARFARKLAFGDTEVGWSRVLIYGWRRLASRARVAAPPSGGS